MSAPVPTRSAPCKRYDERNFNVSEDREAGDRGALREDTVDRETAPVDAEGDGTSGRTRML